MKRLAVVLIASLMLFALQCAPAAAGDWTDELAPHAAGGAASVFPGGDGFECLSWELGRCDDLGLLRWLGPRRAWADVYRPLTQPGLGASIDLSPDMPPYLGIAYARGGWHLMLGVHADLSF